MALSRLAKAIKRSMNLSSGKFTELVGSFSLSLAAFGAVIETLTFKSVIKYLTISSF